MLSQAVLDPGDEIVCGWPSFPSYVIYARQAGRSAITRAAPRPALRPRGAAAAIRPRTKLVYVCHPNNPTGTMNTRAELDACFERCRSTCSRSSTRRTSSTSTSPTIPMRSSEYVKRGRRVLVLRTFSKIYGLAGLRVGYAVGPGEVCAAMAKAAPPVRPRRAGPGGGAREPRRRRRARRAAGRSTRRSRAARGDAARRTDSSRLPARSANFVYVDIGADPPRQLYERCCARA